jgi:hypothetical protein
MMLEQKKPVQEGQALTSSMRGSRLITSTGCVLVSRFSPAAGHKKPVKSKKN